MPPARNMALKRMTANPARPIARYRPGKAPVDQESSDEEEGSEHEASVQPARSKPLPAAARRPQQITSTKLDSDDDEAGFETDEEFEASSKQQIYPHVDDLSAKALAIVSGQTEPGSSEEETESEEDASSDDESSVDEPLKRKFQRPTFIKKSVRQASTSLPFSQEASRDSPAQQTLKATSVQDDATHRRKIETEDLIKSRIERENLARIAGKKSWDDDDAEPTDFIDDTDGLDPAAEQAAWRLRELKRLKRDREKLEAEEREREVRERRSNMTAEEREKEDAERIAQQKEDKEAGRGDNKYLQRYHHKGAFFQGDQVADTLRQRKIMGAKFEDEVDKDQLPEFMQIRDMTKLGKKGRTRHRDLRSDDTGAFGREVMQWRPGDTNRGTREDARGNVDERFLPDRNGFTSSTGPTGANASVVGQRRERRRSVSRTPPTMEDGDSHRPGTGRRSTSRSRQESYSRSPPLPSPRRKRSLSPYRDRDKRRRIGAV